MESIQLSIFRVHTHHSRQRTHTHTLSVSTRKPNKLVLSKSVQKWLVLNALSALLVWLLVDLLVLAFFGVFHVVAPQFHRIHLPHPPFHLLRHFQPNPNCPIDANRQNIRQLPQRIPDHHCLRPSNVSCSTLNWMVFG